MKITHLKNSYSKMTKGQKIYFLALSLSVILHILFFIYFLLSGGKHIDESMCILNARSLVDNGTDIMGERLPVYFDTWLYGGQSPFATYIIALFIKLFGYSLLVVRMPMLIMSIIGLVAYYHFLMEVFLNNERLAIISFVILAFSPWHIVNAVFTLDCSFMHHFFIIGLYLLAKALNTGKARHYIYAMLALGICFYCYIACVLIIPGFLVILYLILIFKKRISLKNTVISVLTITAVAMPFILFGLVHLGYIKELTLLGFSYTEMPYYSRGVSLAPSDYFQGMIVSLAMLLIPDAALTSLLGMNWFIYSNFIGGILLYSGAACCVIPKLRKSGGNILSKSFYPFAIALALTALITVPSTYDGFSSYRYFSYYYLLHILQASGLIFLAGRIKKIGLKRLTCVFLACSLTMLIGEFVIFNTEKMLCNNQNLDLSLSESLDFADTLDCDSLGIVLADEISYENYNVINQNTAVILREHYYGRKNFSSLEKELLSIGMLHKGNSEVTPSPTSDNSIYYKRIGNEEATEACLIIPHRQLSRLEYDKDKYKVRAFGAFDIIYR